MESVERNILPVSGEIGSNSVSVFLGATHFIVSRPTVKRLTTGRVSNLFRHDDSVSIS